MTRPGLLVLFPFRKEPELLAGGKPADGSSFGTVSERRLVTTSGSLGFGAGGGVDSVFFGTLVFGGEFVTVGFEDDFFTVGGV